MTLDLRTEFAKTLKDAGHWVVYRQAHLNMECACTTPQGDSDLECTRCNGTGHGFTDHFVLARRSQKFGSAEMPTNVGKASVPVWTFYLMRNTKPSGEDWIIEVALDQYGEPIRPFQIEQYFDVQDVEIMRGDDGLIAFYQVQTEKGVWNVRT